MVQSRYEVPYSKLVRSETLIRLRECMYQDDFHRSDVTTYTHCKRSSSLLFMGLNRVSRNALMRA